MMDMFLLTVKGLKLARNQRLDWCIMIIIAVQLEVGPSVSFTSAVYSMTINS